MRPTGPAVVQHFLVIAPGVLKCIRQDRHRAEVARVVHLTRESENCVGAPGRGEGEGAKRAAEDVAEKRNLCRLLAPDEFDPPPEIGRTGREGWVGNPTRGPGSGA